MDNWLLKKSVCFVLGPSKSSRTCGSTLRASRSLRPRDPHPGRIIAEVPVGGIWSFLSSRNVIVEMMKNG